MKTVVGVVGAGGISRFHFRAMEETKTPVRIICDVNREAARPHVEKFGADYTVRYEDVVAHRDVTVVVVLVPSPLHYEIVKAALEAGKHVVCEKTLTLSARESLQLGRLAEKNGLLLFTNFMKRFFPAVRKACELVPRLGHIMSVYCRTYQGVGNADIHTGAIPPSFLPGPDGQSAVMKMAGGGVLVCGGSHIADLLLYLVGKPRGVFGRAFERPECDLDFMFHALFDYADGGVAHFEANWHSLQRIGYERRGWDEGFEISGVGGRLVLQTPVWDQPEHNAARLVHYDNATETWTDYAFPIVNPFVEAEKHFLSQIARGEQGPMDRYVGYRVDLVLETAKRSAAAGQRLELDWEA